MKNLFFLLIVLSCLSCHNQVSEAKTPISLEELHVKIDSLFQSRIDKNGPGAVVAISYKQQMIYGKGFGLRDLDTAEPITITTNMRMASVSKQFTALCVLDLVDKGLLSLSDSISSYWDYPVFKNITVENLINHTSGIADYESYFEKNWDRSQVVENKDVLNWLSTNPKPVFKPGDSWEYSNTAYLVLALLVEKISGEEFSQYAKINVFDRIGMKRTNYYNLAKPIDLQERAFCYEKDSLKAWKKVDGFFMNGVMGDGAVYTSIKDYITYDNQLRNNSIFSEKIQQLIFKPSSTLPSSTFNANPYEKRFPFLEGTELQYGMGWFVNEELAMHTGGWYGTRTMVLRELGNPITVLIFMNHDGSFDELMTETYKLLQRFTF